MRILNFSFSVFIFIFLDDPVIHALDINCPYSRCGSNPYSIQFPFILKGQLPQVCSHYIDLTCISQTSTVLSIPFSGDFYVNYVDYSARTVTLLDPKNCLPKRLMKLNLSSSSFAPVYDYQNFTFYNCPGDRPMYNFRVINCLSIDPNVTVVSSQLSPAEMEKFYGCSKISTEEFPLLENDTFSELKLRWNVPSCVDCEGFGPRGKDGSNGNTFKHVEFVLLIPLAIVVAFLVASFKRVAAARSTSRDVALTQQSTTATNAGDGVVQPRLVSVEAMMVPDGQQACLKTMNFSTFVECNDGNLEGHDQGSCCTVCLEEYSPQDVIRCIPSCHHYFHSKCIERWFQDNNTCPVCRNSIIDV
ncbi:putative RING-H2 finger protein ATL21A [Salvia hispanica]|uniref:putative RING-H2 finger protein ATL21A n=1 Tax=Salvia hispanica TaxID=49212 RepID=UPI00200959BB|nr:putative RING-H2 finger protein ATL21A [Salvia hispanica]